MLLLPLILIGLNYFPFVRLEEISFYLHNQCLESLNFNSPWKNIYEALICGKKLPHSHLKEVFIKGGLIHLMVVSGAHLLFLEKFYLKMSSPLSDKLQSWFLFFILLIYAITTGFYPPVARSLFAFCLFQYSRSHKLFFSSHFITCCSGFLCLLYNPQWISSYSLQLSWLASLTQNTKGLLKKAFWTYVFILPIINNWNQVHPFSILINWLIAPIIGVLLFPLTVISSIFYPLRFITDGLWQIVYTILEGINFLPANSYLLSWALPKQWTWAYIALVIMLVSIKNIWQKKYIYKISKLKH